MENLKDVLIGFGLIICVAALVYLAYLTVSEILP